MSAAVRVSAVLLFSVVPTAVRAYSDPLQFASPTLEAGGGGRFYTGSPADAYGCDGCHTGGEQPPELELLGVPQRYVPGASYELTLRWPSGLEHAAAVLELTDAGGRGAGELLLPPAAEQDAQELCEPKADGVLATQLVPAERGRVIASVPDCGASALRVQWRAPARAGGTVWLAGGVLESNHDGDFTGDGATHFAHAVPAFGAPTVPSTQAIAGSCAVRPVPRARPPVALGAVWGLAGLGLWRRARRARWVSPLLALAAGCAAEGDALPAPLEIHHGHAVRPWDPPDSRDGGVDAAAAVDAATGPGLSFRVTTLPQGGRYSPKNVGAIWIENGSGAWLKSLAVWAGVRQRYLRAFGEVNPTRNEVDAITSGTLRDHLAHEVHWDLKDAAGAPAPPGSYAVVVEVTDRDGPGDVVRIPFELGAEPLSVMPDDAEHFSDLELQYQP